MPEAPEPQSTRAKAPRNAAMPMGTGGPSPGSREKTDIDIAAMRIYVARLKAKSDQEAEEKGVK